MNAFDAYLILHSALTALGLAIGMLLVGTFIYQWYLDWRRQHPHKTELDDLSRISFLDE